jgi:hypothetical protein
MRTISVFIWCVIFYLLFVAGAFAYPTAMVTAKVVDERGESVLDADVSVSFMKPKVGGWGMTTYNKDGKSDKNGLFSASGEGTQSVSIFVTKDGYYPSGGGVKLTSKSLLNRWEPWNPTVEVVLKKKRNPVGMYVKGGTSTSIPVFDQPVGYDLEQGDWVSPHGLGVIDDFIFNCQYNRVDFDNAEASCKITFANENDGIQEFVFDENNQSYYKWPFEAPEENYKNSLHKWMTLHFPGEGYKSNINEKVNYLFRVRTKTDQDGNIIAANYGKVEKDFLISRKGKVKFFYYFNPDGTRNLEEDPEKNLFKKR